MLAYNDGSYIALCVYIELMLLSVVYILSHIDIMTYDAILLLQKHFGPSWFDFTLTLFLMVFISQILFPIVSYVTLVLHTYVILTSEIPIILLILLVMRLLYHCC